MTADGASLPRRFALTALPATLLLVAFLWYGGGGNVEGALAATALDFRVVYCGGEALRAGGDPYSVEPLRACEHRVGREPGEPAWAVTPVPLPGYALALLAPLSLLPFVPAKALWAELLVLAFAAASACVASLARTPTLAVAAVFAPTIGFGINLHYGEPVPLAIAALCAAALALARDAPRAAAALAVLASVEPHVALPACIALGLFVPRARVALGLSLLAAAALWLASMDVGRVVEYFTTVLPVQARAELLARDQFGLARYLALAGVPDQVALWLGAVSYAASTGFGVWGGRRLAAAHAQPGLLVLFPVAIAMLGGAFVHDVQIAAALPAAALLAPYTRLARIALALLVLDWTSWWRDQVIPALSGAAGTATLGFPHARARALLWFLTAPLVSLALLAALARMPEREIAAERVRAAAAAVAAAAPRGAPERLAANDSASTAWALRIAVEPGWSALTARDVVEKLPLWIALALLAAAASREGRRDAA